MEQKRVQKQTQTCIWTTDLWQRCKGGLMDKGLFNSARKNEYAYSKKSFGLYLTPY